MSYGSNNLALGGSNEANFAPAAPLQSKIEQNTQRPKALDAWAKELRDQFRRYYQSTWDRKVLVAQKNELYYRGFQRLKRADYDNYWRILDDNPLAYTLNVFRFWSDLITSKWVASNPDYDIQSGKPYDSRIRSGADYADTVIEHYERKFFTQTENIRQSKRAQNEGNLYWYFYYDPNAKAKAQQPILNQTQVKLGTDGAICNTCGYAGQLPDFEPSAQAVGIPPAGNLGSPPQNNPATEEVTRKQITEQNQARINQGQPPAPPQICPICGSNAIQNQIAQMTPLTTVQGFQEYDTGDVCWRGVQIYNIRYDPTVSLEDSSWLLWEEYFDRDVLAETYPSLQLPTENYFPSGIDTGLTVKSQLEQHGSYRYGSSIENPKRTLFTRMWLEPAKYCKYIVPDTFQTADGQIIQAGSRLLDACPEGAYLAMAGDLVVDIRPEAKNEHWLQMMYHIPATGGLGDGIEDMQEPQRQRNVLKSQANLWIRASATPGGLYNPLLVDGNQYTGDPDNLIPIKYENLGILQGIGIENAIFHPTPSPMHPAIFQYIQGLDSDEQLAAHTTDYSGGLPGVNNSTATGAQITQALSASIHTLQLAQYADFRKRAACTILKLYKKYCPEVRCFSIAGPNGQLQSKFFSGLDIDDDLVIDVINNSWLPRTSQEQAERMSQALLAIGGIQGLAILKQQMPEVVAKLADIYNVDFGDSGYKEARTVTRDRLDQIQKNLPSVQQTAAQIPAFQPQPVTDPATGQPTGQMVNVPVDPTTILAQQLVGTIQPPINPLELGHQESIEELRSWMLQDEGRQADPILRAAVQAMAMAHFQGIQAEAQLGAALQQAAQPQPPPGAANNQGPASGGGGSNNAEHPAKTPTQHRNASAKGAINQPTRGKGPPKKGGK